MTKEIIGVDLGGTSVKLAILDVLGNIEINGQSQQI